MSLANIRIVLVRTFHGGNIGSAARSVKTMALSPLHLVAPKDYPSDEATKMAAGAEDWLNQSTQHEDIATAIHGCGLVIATTARPRGYDLPVVHPKQAAQKLIEHSAIGPVALLFGPERMGLHNEDIQYAHYRLTIPANPEYSSLNLASAVQIMSYEIYQAQLEQPSAKDQVDNAQALPPSEQFEQLIQQLEWLLARVKFLRAHQGETLLRIRHFIRRSQPTLAEMSIMLGALNAIKRTIANSDDS